MDVMPFTISERVSFFVIQTLLVNHVILNDVGWTFFDLFLFTPQMNGIEILEY